MTAACRRRHRRRSRRRPQSLPVGPPCAAARRAISTRCRRRASIERSSSPPCCRHADVRDLESDRCAVARTGIIAPSPTRIIYYRATRHRSHRFPLYVWGVKPQPQPHLKTSLSPRDPFLAFCSNARRCRAPAGSCGASASRGGCFGRRPPAGISAPTQSEETKPNALIRGLRSAGAAPLKMFAQAPADHEVMGVSERHIGHAHLESDRGRA